MNMGKGRGAEESEHACECGSTHFAFDPSRGETICQECGLVREEHIIDSRREYRVFSDAPHGNARDRVGAPPREFIHDRGLSTTIDRRNRDFNGNPISRQMVPKIQRIRQWQNRLGNQASYNLAYALSQLNKLVSQAQYPTVALESACKLYRKVVKARITRGHSLEEMVAACLLLALRQCKIPATLEDVADLTRVDRRSVAQCARFVVKRLNMSIGPTKVLKFVPKVCAKLGLSHDVQRLAAKLVRKAVKLGLGNGRNPMSIVAASMWMACKLLGVDVMQKDVAKVAGVTPVSLRAHYYELEKRLRELA
ncbi:MAG: transcription initiation factor IIB [Promethearchaeota archaeon]